MILVITPNPALDLTYRLPQLLVGESQRTAPALERPGGKGLNVARVLQAQGHPVRALLPLGGHTGQLIASALDEIGLPHTIVPVAGQTRRTLALVTAQETSNISESGAPLTDTEWRRFVVAAQQAAAAARVVVISGSLPPGAPENLLPELISAARQAGAACLADVSGKALLAAAAAGADLLKPNEAELREATGIADPLAAAEHLVALGARRVLVSRGADGMFAVASGGQEVRWARLGRNLSGNPTGAGDAAVAACAAHTLRHARTVQAADTAATAVAAAPTVAACAPPFAGAELDAMLGDAVAWSAAAVLAPVAGEIADPAQFYPEITVSDYPRSTG